MKNQTIFLIPVTLLMMAVVTALPAFASNSKTHSTPRGDVICAPEDTETHTLTSAF